MLIESFGYDADLYEDYALQGDQPGELRPFVGVPRLQNLDWVVSVTTPDYKRFAGYGSTTIEKDAFRFRSLSRETDGFFVKFSYLFRL